MVVYTTVILLQNNFNPRKFITYDGHYSYQIAIRFFESPENVEDMPADYKYREDVPNAYRYQRILYPAFARFLALGQADLIPWTMIILNLVAICGGTFITEKILEALGVSRWYALIYGLYGSQLVSLRTGLNEPLAQGLIQFAIFFWLRRRLFWTVLFFTLAALAKEIGIIFLGAFIIGMLFKKDWRWVAGLSAGAVPYIAFQIFLYVWRGEFGFSSGRSFYTIPFGGWLRAAEISLGAFLLVSLPIVPMSIFPAVASIYLGLKSLMKRLYHPFVFSMIFFSLFILFLPFETFSEPAAMMRITQGLAVSILFYGALVKSDRTLNYSFLWLATNALILKDVTG